VDDSVALASALAKDPVVLEAGQGVFGHRSALAVAHSLLVESFVPLPVVSSSFALMERAAAVEGKDPVPEGRRRNPSDAGRGTDG